MTAIYVRQSVEKKDSISIEGQIEKCLTETEGEYEIYQDKGFSGKNIKRPAFLKMLQDVQKCKVTKIVVYRLDRFSRSITDFSKIWEILCQYHVDFVSINEKFDTASPMGRAMLHIIMVFAQLERETISERITDNYYMRAKSGAWTGGPAPFGFSIQKKMYNNKKISYLSPNQYSNMVLQIFENYQKKESSLGSIAKEMTKIYKNKIWDSVTISRILHNPVYVQCNQDIYHYYQYKNYIMQNDIEQFNGKNGGMIIKKHSNETKYFLLAYHEGFVPSELFLKCQYKLENNKQLKNSGKGKYTFLSGLLKCGVCGYSLKVISSKGKRYFVCTGRTNHYIKHSNEYISLDKLEQAFQQELYNMIQNNTITQKHYEINIIDEKINRLIKAVSESNEISIKYINIEIEKLQQQKNDILKKQNNIFCEKINSFHSIDLETQKYIAKQMIEKINVFAEKAEFYWKM